MEFPESPARQLAGPARARVLARQNRNSATKPYARPSFGSPASNSLHTADAESPAPRPVAANPSPSRSAFSPIRVAATPIALLGSVRKMVTKPLSWLTSTVASSVEPELGMPTSSSTNSLSSLARKRAAAQAAIKSSSGETSYERDAPTRAARAVGERLAAGLRSRTTQHDDEESQLRPPPTSNTLSSSQSMSRLAPGPAPPRITRKPSHLNNNASPRAGPSSLPSAADSDVAKPWSSRSSKRTLDIGGSRLIDAMSDVAPTSPSSAQRYAPRSPHTLRSPRSQLLGLRGSSLRPDDAMSESGSTSLSHSHSFSAFGYGNEVRYADSAFGLPPSTSPFQLRNTASRRSRAPFSSGLFTETGTPGRTSRAGSVGLRTASPAPSAGYSPARGGREGTPQRRNWNGLNLAAPSAPSLGDEMMREYLASRTLPGINPPVRRNLGLSTDDPMNIASSVAAGSVMDETESLTPSRLGKRDIDMSVDGDSERLTAVGTPSKRRMVWHPELGFISHEELKAREPKPPTPKNEAERLLNVLETLRKPTTTSRAGKGPPTSINVPAPISDLPVTAARTAKSNEGNPAVGVAPYTRYLRKAKAVQCSEELGGMRARLKKAQPTPAATNDIQEEESAASQDEDAQQEVEEEEESEEEPSPQPQPEPVRRSRRLQHQQPDSTEAVPQTPAKQQTDKPSRSGPQLKSALKATPLRPSAAQQLPAETPKPASHRIPLSAASASKPATSAAVRKDNFSIKAASTDPSAPRERSSLRQGAAKTSRTHQSSGKFSAWDEDEEEDLPDATELAKIKLPTNMFPSGFSFAGSSSAAAPAKSDAPVEKKDDSTSGAPAPAPASSGSLLGRMGGFDSSAPEKAEAPKPAAPSFTFAAPTKNAPSSMPKFSFGAPAAPAKDDSTGASKKPTAAPPASDFFSKPSEPASKSNDDGKKDGPVPNFFGSTMKKFEAAAPAPAAAPAASGGFSFGAPSTSAAAGDKPAFSFGAPKPATDAPSTTTSASSNTFGSFGAKPADAAERKKEDPAPTSAGKSSFFGNASNASSGAGGFTFGAPPSNAALTTAKRSADTDDEQVTKKSMPSFSFRSNSAKPADPASSTSGGFSFGTPAEKKEESKSGGVPNFFGAKGGDSSTPAASGFTFGKPADSTSTTATPASGGFTFGAPKPASTADAPKASTGFSFGSSTPSAEGASKPASTFTFGAPKPADAPASGSTSAAGSGATTPTSSFTFGAPAAAPAAEKPSGGGFTFGTPAATTPSSTGFGNSSAGSGFGGFGTQPKPQPSPSAGNGGGEMMDDSPAKSAPAPAPSFTFGSSTPSSSAPSTSGGKPFTFGAPPASSAAPSTSTPSFSFGAPAIASNPAPGGGFRFGSPAPTTSAAPATGFTFGSSTGGSTTPGVGSTPASPFLAPAAVPTTPGGSPFQFGAPPAQTGGAPFQFGAPAPAPAASTNTGFTFGTPSTPQQSQPTFGAGGGGFGAPTTPGAAAPGGGGFTFGTPAGNGMPQMPQMPQGGAGLFSMGAAPSAGPGSPATPGAAGAGGRAIKPLRQRRR